MMSSVIYYSNDGRKNEIDSLNHRENSNETVSCYKSLLKCSEALYEGCQIKLLIG